VETRSPNLRVSHWATPYSPAKKFCKNRKIILSWYRRHVVIQGDRDLRDLRSYTRRSEMLGLSRCFQDSSRDATRSRRSRIAERTSGGGVDRDACKRSVDAGESEEARSHLHVAHHMLRVYRAELPSSLATPAGLVCPSSILCPLILQYEPPLLAQLRTRARARDRHIN